MNLVAGTVSGHCIRVSDEGGVCTYGWVVDGGVEDVCGAGGLCVVVVVCGSGCMVVVVGGGCEVHGVNSSQHNFNAGSIAHSSNFFCEKQQHIRWFSKYL